MAMTKEEKMTKQYIWRKLSEEGYPTYARIFWDLDLHLTAAPRVVGYMEPKDGTITINRNLDEDQFSVIIRHEILHNYLQHEKRLLNHLAEQRGLDPDDLNDLDIKDIKDVMYGDQDFNIAGDYEISNRGYTEEDKDTVRRILLNGEELQGLVTEDEHPEWVNWSIEDMYDAIKKEKQQAQNEAQQDLNDQQDQDENEGSGEGQDSDGDPQAPNSPQNQSSQSGGKNSKPDQNGGQPGDQSDGGGGDSDDDGPEYVYGSFIDDETFMDEDGNIVTFDEGE